MRSGVERLVNQARLGLLIVEVDGSVVCVGGTTRVNGDCAPVGADLNGDKVVVARLNGELVAVLTGLNGDSAAAPRGGAVWNGLCVPKPPALVGRNLRRLSTSIGSILALRVAAHLRAREV